MKKLHMVAFILLIIGGLNWLLVGLFDWGIADLIGKSLGRIIYILVGLAAIIELVKHKQNCVGCQTGTSASVPPTTSNAVG